MSTTIAHRHHVHHVPLTPILAVLAAALVAAALIWAINQPPTTTTTETQAVSAPLVLPAEVAVPESPAIRRQLAETMVLAAPAAGTAYSRNHVQGVTLDPAGATSMTSPGDTLSQPAGQPFEGWRPR